MRFISILSLFALILSSCTQNEQVKVYYGEKFELSESLTADELITLLDEEQAVDEVIVEGQIEKSCTHSGCWMTLVNDKGEEIFVTYKDEAFTTAKKISGRKVALKGSAQKDESKDQYKFVATGLIIN